MTTLALLPAGSRAVVAELPPFPSLAKRLIAFGLTPGAEVRVLQNRGRGPVLIEVHCARVALGWGQAAKIHVEPVADGQPLEESLTCPGEPGEER